MINCLLLSAGYGSRLKPLTNKNPKCLIKVKNQPILSHWIHFLKKNNVNNILVNTHYFHNKVEKFINDYNLQDIVTLSFEQNLLGTGGSILKNKLFFKNKSFFVAHVDNYTVFNLKDFIKFHKQRPPDIIGTMMVFRVCSTKEYGIIKKSQQNILINFFEKQDNIEGTLANAAIYIFEPEIINILTNIGEKYIDISLDLIPQLLNKVQIYENKNFCIDIGTLNGLQRANKIKLKDIKSG